MEDLVAWQLCEELADFVVEITANGPSSRHGDFCDQIRRASDGPGPHIAEGFGRFTPREFAHYPRMAVGSLMESRSLLLRGGRRGYWPADACNKAISLYDRALDVTRKLLAAKVRQIEREKAEKTSRQGALRRVPKPPVERQR